MSGFAIAVLEKKPRWVPELKRRFLGTETLVRGYSTARELIQAVETGTGVVLLSLDDQEETCLDLLGRFNRRTIPPRMIVVSSNLNAELEWPVRELGATDFVKIDTPSDEMLTLCRRLLESREATTKRTSAE